MANISLSPNLISFWFNETCQSFLLDEVKEDGFAGLEMCCPMVCDNARCWPPTSTGLLATVPCPEFYNGKGYNPQEKATRECLATGAWAMRANYTPCMIPEMDTKSMSVVALICYSISFTSICLALFIFRYFKALYCLRNLIHTNLCVALLLNIIAVNFSFVFVMCTSSKVEGTKGTIAANIVLNVALSIQSFATLALFFWMFVEGIYLCTIVYCTFHVDKLKFWPYAITGWGIPGILTLILISIDLAKDPYARWINVGVDKYFYSIPICVVLALNLILLIAILSAISTKLRVNSKSDSTPCRPLKGNQFASPCSLAADGAACSLAPSSSPTTPAYCSLSAEDCEADQQQNSCVEMKSPQKTKCCFNFFQICPCLHASNSIQKNQRRRSTKQTEVSIVVENVISRRNDCRRTFSLTPTLENPTNSSSDERLEEEQSASPDVGVRRGTSHFNSLSRESQPTLARLRFGRVAGGMSSKQLIKLIKATLTLMPLLGIPEIIFIVPYHKSLDRLFLIINSLLRSTQGFWVALLYCFLSDEVRKQLRQRVRTWTIRSRISSNKSFRGVQRPRRSSPQLRYSRQGPSGV